MTSPTVAVGYVHSGVVHHEFLRFVVGLLARDFGAEQHVVVGGSLIGTSMAASLAHSRNTQVEEFLAGLEEWLWMVDTDESFEPDALARLLASAHPASRPVMA